MTVHNKITRPMFDLVKSPPSSVLLHDFDPRPIYFLLTGIHL